MSKEETRTQVLRNGEWVTLTQEELIERWRANMTAAAEESREHFKKVQRAFGIGGTEELPPNFVDTDPDGQG